MTIPINDQLVPRTTGYKLIDDADVAGSLHTVADVTARDALPVYNRKVGMLVYTITENKYWKCTDTAIPTWVEFSTGGSASVDTSDFLLSTTGATSIVTYTPPVQGNYTLYIYYRVVTAATNLTLTVSWTDSSGAQTQTTLSDSSQAIGSYVVVPTFLNSVTSAIAVTATAGTANQIYISSSIVSV